MANIPLGFNNFDPHFNHRDMYGREELLPREDQRRRWQEEERRRQLMHNAVKTSTMWLENPKPDPKDPLAFLTKTDTKLLLTGETP